MKTDRILGSGESVPATMPPRTGDGEMLYRLKKKSRDKMKQKKKQKSKDRLKYLRRKEKSGSLSKEEKKEMKKLSQKK